MAPTSNNLPPDTRPLIISGPSGVGKGTLYNRLFAAHPNTFLLSVSCTTRSPRPGEQDGVHYHFVTPQHFADLVSQGGFLEHATFGGNSYGTPKSEVSSAKEKGKVVVLDIEMEGVKQVKKSGVDARYVFVAPPSMEELEKRLRGRGTEKEESVQKRLRQAVNELEYSREEGVHDLVIVNDDLERAYGELEEFVYRPVQQ
ncbi:guanylate kinase [Coniochaeta sp. 2T2.1]|nr:guanylate kinase [Coniochaeta sp. 2T2.1]